MEYLKVWTSFAELLEPLTDDECGRLFKSMLEYARSGEAMELTGNERFVWPAARQSINYTRDKSEQMKANGSKPKQKEAKASKPEQTEANESKPEQRQAKASSLFDKEKDNINIKETPLTGSKEKAEAKASAAALDRSFDKFWAVYPRHTAKQDAKRAFLRISPDDTLLNTMLTAIQRQKQTEQWSDPRYVPHPATWLNGRRWEDEPAAARAAPGKTVSAARYQQRDYDEADLEERLGVNDLFRGGPSQSSGYGANSA